MSDTMCMAPRKTGPCSGPYFCWIRILLYIGSFDPLLYVLLSSFRRRPLAPYANFPCNLSFLPSNVTAPPSTPRPPPRFWIQLTKLPSIRTPNFSANVATQVSPARPTSHSSLSFSFLPSTHSARSVLVPTALDSRIKYPLAWPRQRQAIVALLSPSFLVCVRSTLARPIDDQPSQRAIVRLPVSRFICTPSLAIFSSSQIVSCRYRLKCTHQRTCNIDELSASSRCNRLSSPSRVLESSGSRPHFPLLLSYPSDSELTYVDQPSTLQ